jgi:Kef-type K+ transport system membrane component KefB
MSWPSRPSQNSAFAITVLVAVPAIARRIKIPEIVGLLIFGVIHGPHVRGFFGELGKLLLMFSAGLEMDIALFRQAQAQSITFGLVTTLTPLVLGSVCVVAPDGHP